MDGFEYGDPGSVPGMGNIGTGPIDPISGLPTSDPSFTPGTPGVGWGTPGNLGTFLTDIQNSGLGSVLGSLFGGQYGNLSQMAAFGGIGALLSRLGGGGGSQAPVGYQGGIPKYTIERTQTPVSEQRPVTYESLSAKPGEMAAAVMVPKPYRPGQGGITYFRPIRYTKTGQDLGAAPVTSAPATGNTTGGSNVGIDTGGSVATPGYTGPVTVDGQTIEYAAGGYMPGGGIAMYAGGRYLRGPGDGVSDSIPAKFEESGRPARLADGEFVIDARTVSEIGNGSSEAGARKLYAMMDRVHKARKTAKRGKPSGADKYLPK